MKMSIERGRSDTDRVEQKYWENVLLQFHICSTSYARGNVFETSPSLGLKKTAPNNLNHEKAFDVILTVHHR